jgi:hypothetical protein
VGNIVFNEYASYNDTLVTYKNNYTRDITAIKRLQPRIDWSKATNADDRKIQYNSNKVKK